MLQNYEKGRNKFKNTISYKNEESNEPFNTFHDE